jgi:hypothetical protein
MNLQDKISSLYDSVKPIAELVAKDVAAIWLDVDALTTELAAATATIKNLALAEERAKEAYGALIQKNENLTKELARVNAHFQANIDTIKGQATRLADITKENSVLRASLANSSAPCVYCNLAREEWAKCSSGFPGCGRADDAMLCPHVGVELETADKLAKVTAERDALRRDAERWKYWKPRMIAADFEWGQCKEPVLVFSLNCKVSVDIDKSTDEAIAATGSNHVD